MRLVGLWLLALSAAAIGQYPGAQPVPRQWKVGFDSIREADARELVGILAGPDFQGRSPRSFGYAAAAGFVASKLRELGLKPGGDDGSFFNHFTLVESTLDPAGTKLTLPTGKTFTWGTEFRCGAPNAAKGEVSVAYVCIPEGSDPSKLDLGQLKGKWLVTDVHASHRPFWQKVQQNKRFYGYLGFVSVSAEPLERVSNPGRINVVKDTADPRITPISSLSITKAIADEIATSSGASNYLSASRTSASIEVAKPCQVETAVTLGAELRSANVVAILEGSDPSLRGEYVLYGSHLDHMGVRGGQTYWGADDNASGCTANLMMARAFVRNTVKPRRSVIFAFYSLEEEGTHGSWAMMSRPPVPADKIVANINMDMLGRNEEGRGEDPTKNTKMVYPGSVKLNSMDFYNLLVRMNSHVGLELRDDKEDRTDRSDTRNTVVFGIPTLKVFTGEHPDYHRPGDTPDKINYPKLTNIAKWLYLTGQELASQEARPRFEPRPWGG
ncbi:MAG TPA: M28 family peptidase [Fimbriimonadaceae bacterium]|nr:M28 family peptidase [Fimbriimonadaceae bacterium]